MVCLVAIILLVIPAQGLEINMFRYILLYMYVNSKFRIKKYSGFILYRRISFPRGSGNKSDLEFDDF